MKRILFSITVALFLFSCGGGEKKKEAEKKTDSIADTTTTLVPEDTVSAEVKATEDLASTSVEELEKSGEGLSFCDCVKKQKELDDQLAAAEDDKLIEELLQKSEDLRNGECIILKVGSQQTASQKNDREKKVKKCLEE